MFCFCLFSFLFFYHYLLHLNKLSTLYMMGIKLILFSKMSKPHWHMERRIELNATSGCEKKVQWKSVYLLKSAHFIIWILYVLFKWKCSSQMIFTMCFNLRLLFTHNFSRYTVIPCRKQYLLYHITPSTGICYIWFHRMSVRKLSHKALGRVRII